MSDPIAAAEAAGTAQAKKYTLNGGLAETIGSF